MIHAYWFAYNCVYSYDIDPSLQGFVSKEELHMEDVKQIDVFIWSALLELDVCSRDNNCFQRKTLCKILTLTTASFAFLMKGLSIGIRKHRLPKEANNCYKLKLLESLTATSIILLLLKAPWKIYTHFGTTDTWLLRCGSKIWCL